jgi:isopropylmalate/homocitrate/citramalate synthase
VLNDRATYEIIDPLSVGVASGNLCVMVSTPAGTAWPSICAQMGYDLNEDQLIRVFARFKVIADRKSLVDSIKIWKHWSRK